MVQKRLNERRKNDGIGRIAGHKVALTSQAIQKLVGLTSPIAASIFSSTIYLISSIMYYDFILFIIVDVWNRLEFVQLLFRVDGDAVCEELSNRFLSFI